MPAPQTPRTTQDTEKIARMVNELKFRARQYVRRNPGMSLDDCQDAALHFTAGLVDQCAALMAENGATQTEMFRFRAEMVAKFRALVLPRVETECHQ